VALVGGVEVAEERDRVLDGARGEGCFPFGHGLLEASGEVAEDHSEHGEFGQIDGEGDVSGNGVDGFDDAVAEDETDRLVGVGDTETGGNSDTLGEFGVDAESESLKQGRSREGFDLVRGIHGKRERVVNGAVELTGGREVEVSPVRVRGLVADLAQCLCLLAPRLRVGGVYPHQVSQ
jgi:hypothetical protein